MDSYTCTQFVDFAEPLSYVNGTISTIYTLDAACFTKPDLNLFMESLETIARIKRERLERRQQRRMQKIHEARIAQLKEQQLEEEERHNISPIPSADEAVDEPIMLMEAKWIPNISDPLTISPKKGCGEYDEAYGSANQSPCTSVSSCSGQDSDSTESCFYSGTPSPLRPRSQVITTPKNRATHSRIISMMIKREYTKALSTETMETPLSNETHQISKKQLLNRTIKHQHEKLSALEQNLRFLDKALSQLTL